LTKRAERVSGEGAGVEGLMVQPWRKWGHDFLYVNDAAGSTLGYFDRNTGLLHVADRRNRAAVLAALAPQVGDKLLMMRQTKVAV